MNKLNFSIIIFLFSYICFSQNTLNYSVNSGSGSKNTDSLSINYVIGEPIILNSPAMNNIILADLIDSTSGIYSFDNHIIKVFPNPTSNYIIISFPITDNYNIDLIDNLGKTIGNIYDGNIIENTDKKISFTHFNISSGAYLLHIKSKQIDTYMKIIIL